MRHLHARQYSDQMYCSHCGKTWDVDDIEPPACMSGYDKFIEMRNELRRINQNERTTKRSSSR